MYIPFLSVLFGLHFLLRVVEVAGGFTNPPPSSQLTYQEGALVNITWDSPLKRIALTLWHNVDTDFEYLLPDSGNITNTGFYPWIVGSTKTIAGASFNFFIFNPGNTTAEFGSSKFKITLGSSAFTTLSTTASISSSSSFSTSSSSSSSSSVSNTATNSQASTPIASPSTAAPIKSPGPAQINSGLSRGGTAGLAVGLIIGAPLLLAFGIFIGRKLRSGQQSDFNGEHNRIIEMDNNNVTGWTALHIPKPLQGSNVASELHSQPIHEIGHGE